MLSLGTGLQKTIVRDSLYVTQAMALTGRRSPRYPLCHGYRHCPQLSFRRMGIISAYDVTISIFINSTSQEVTIFNLKVQACCNFIGKDAPNMASCAQSTAFLEAIERVRKALSCGIQGLSFSIMLIA